MEQFGTLATSLGAWWWLIAAVACFVIELHVPGVHFIWFGLAGAIVGILALANLLNLEWQLIAFAVISLALIVTVRMLVGPKIARRDAPDLNERGQQYVGRVVTLEEPIVAGRGRVRVGDTIWPAQGPDTPAGAHMKVTGVAGTVLIVEMA